MFSASKLTLFNQPTGRREQKSQVTIRAATYEDIDVISWLVVETYKQTYRLLEYRVTDTLDKLFGQEYRDKLRAELADTNLQYLVCEDQEGRVVGFSKIKFGYPDEKIAFLDKIYLLRDYQGAGNGHRLIKECFKLAADRHIYAMELEAWDQNVKAHEFYKSMASKYKAILFPTHQTGLKPFITM